MLLLALLMGHQYSADAAGRVALQPLKAGHTGSSTGSITGRHLRQSAVTCESFKGNSSDVPEAMLKFGLSIAGMMPYIGPVASFFSAIAQLGEDLQNKPSM